MSHTIQKLQKLSQEDLNEILNESAAKNHFELLKTLLTSNELTIHADIHNTQEFPLKSAIYNGHIQIVKYLLESPELKEHSNPHHKSLRNGETTFEFICNVRNFARIEEAINYLTLEYAVEKKDIEAYRELLKYSTEYSVEHIKEQVSNNVMILLINEKDDDYKLKLDELLQKFDPQRHQKFMLKQELEKDLLGTEKKVSRKSKI